MSLKFGLGNSKDDIEIQGEIDYDFFDEGTSSGSIWPATRAEIESKSARNSTVYSTSPDQTNQQQALISDSLLVSLNCKSDAPFFANAPTFNLESADETPVSNRKNSSEELNIIKRVEYSENKSKYPRKVIETVIPNLDDNVTNCTSPDEDNAEKKLEENSGSLSSSMTDSDDTSSLSEDSFGALSESESITDVTPLHSPYCCDSPVPQVRTTDVTQSKEDCDPSKDMDCSEEDHGSKQKDSVHFSEELGWCRESEPVDLNALVAAIQRLEIQQGHHAIKQRNCITPPLVRPRKNMSFSNEEVRRIDQENQRLLKKILAQQTRSKPLSMQPRGSHVSSSQVNRHRQQRQAEIENVALLKRIESAKPSRELSRVKLLRDYNRLSPSLSSRSQSRPSTAASSLHVACIRSRRSHSLPSSNETSTSATPSTLQERPKTVQGISNLHAVGRLQKQRSLH